MEQLENLYVYTNSLEALRVAPEHLSAVTYRITLVRNVYRHNLLDENNQPRLKHFDDAFANMFPTTTETVKTIRSIRELHATYPEDKPKGGLDFGPVTYYSFPIRLNSLIRDLELVASISLRDNPRLSGALWRQLHRSNE